MGQILLVRHGQASFGSSNYDQLSEHGQEQARLLGQWFAERGQRFDRVVSGTMMRHRQTAQACLGALPGAPAADAWLEDAGFNEYDHDAVLHCHRPDFAEPGAVRRFIAATDNGNRVFQRIFEDSMARWMSGAHDADYREPWPVFRQRCVDALTRLLQASGPSQTAVVFTSGGTIATLCQHVLRMPDAQMFALNWTLVNSAVTKLYHRAAPEPVAAAAATTTAAMTTGAAATDAATTATAATPRILSLGYLNNYAHLEATNDPRAVTYR